jgi:hypothetical protein
MSNFTLPIQEAFGRYLRGWHDTLIPDTQALAEYASRPFSKAAAWVPGRMVDSVQEMIDSWRKNDTSREARATPYLPMLLAGMSKDYAPAPPDWSRQAADTADVTIPGDAKGRVFKMRVAFSEIRIQIAILSPDAPTARSLAMQLQLYSSAIERRRLYTEYKLAGSTEKWPFVWREPDLMGINLPQDVKNLTVNTVDFTGVASVPMLWYPRTADEDSDGQGGNDYADPNGYLVVKQGDIFSYPGDERSSEQHVQQVGDLES